MKYINKKTRAVINTACEIKGGNWEKVSEPNEKDEKETENRIRTRKKGAE